MWASEATATDRFQKALQRVRSQSGNLCDVRGLYDYQYDPAGEWLYFNHTCARICASFASGPDCFLGTELVQESFNDILFVTEIKQTIYEQATDGRTLSSSSSRYWTPVEDAYSFNLGYSFHVPEHEVKTMNNLWSAEEFIGSSALDTYTVVLDADGERRRVVPPASNNLAFTVKELLQLANKQDWLDSEQPGLGRNYKEDATKPLGPIGRLTGVQINLRVRCYNPVNVPAVARIKGYYGPVCTLQVAPAADGWVWRRVTDALHGRTRHVLYHGVLVHVESDGALRTLDLSALISFLVESVVLLQMPASFFRFLATRCLGDLSRIYEGVLDQRFSLAQHVASSAMYLLSCSTSFSQIADAPAGLSLPEMSTRVANTLADFHELSSAELKAFVLFCFTIALDVRHNRYTNYRKASSLKKKVFHQFHKLRGGTNKYESLDEYGTEHEVEHIMDKHIGSGAFVIAASIQQKVAIDHVVRLFDKDRKIGLLEKFFLPRWIREHVLRLHSFACSDNCILLPEESVALSRMLSAAHHEQPQTAIHTHAVAESRRLSEECCSADVNGKVSGRSESFFNGMVAPKTCLQEASSSSTVCLAEESQCVQLASQIKELERLLASSFARLRLLESRIQTSGFPASERLQGSGYSAAIALLDLHSSFGAGSEVPSSQHGRKIFARGRDLTTTHSAAVKLDPHPGDFCTSALDEPMSHCTLLGKRTNCNERSSTERT